MKEVYIVSAVRTAIGSFGGMFKGLSAVDLGAAAIKGALEKAGVSPEQVEEVYMGNVCQANIGQNPARQAALEAGLPNLTPSTTVNKVCASGTKAIMFGSQQIMSGNGDIIVCGGMESMTNVPYYVPKARFGYKYGSAELVDGLQKDGLENVYDKNAMGVFADATASKYGFSREDQDAFALESYRRSKEATENGKFKEEIVPVMVPQRKGDPIEVTEDEEYKNLIAEKVGKLRPAFTKDGTVTAVNASTINDGASALILMSKEKVEELGLTPMARIVSFADAAHEPEWFTTAPTKAAPRALEKAGLSKDDMDLFEVNEAFSVVTMAFNKVMEVDPAKTNVHGGAVSLGHPLGCSGARIVTTLVNALHTEGGKYGQAAICNGGGGASSMIVEKL